MVRETARPICRQSTSSHSKTHRWWLWPHPCWCTAGSLPERAVCYCVIVILLGMCLVALPYVRSMHSMWSWSALFAEVRFMEVVVIEGSCWGLLLFRFISWQVTFDNLDEYIGVFLERIQAVTKDEKKVLFYLCHFFWLVQASQKILLSRVLRKSSMPSSSAKSANSKIGQWL